MAANKFSEILTAKVVDNKAVALSAKYTHAPFSVIGSSMAVSAQHNSIEDSTAQVTIYPQPDQDGIIAICARLGWKNAEPDTFYGFLSVTWKEKDGQKYPFVELEEMWSPSERIGHMQEDVITVQIRGKTFFSSPKSRAYLMTEKKRGYLCDANLLCRYLAGTATAAEVLHFTTQTYVEESVRTRLSQALEEKAQLKTQIDDLGRERDLIKSEVVLLRKVAAPLVNFFEKIPNRLRSAVMNAFITAMQKN